MVSRSLYDRITDTRPRVEGPMSYSRLLEFLQSKSINRIDFYDNCRTAIVEVPMTYDEEEGKAPEVQRWQVDMPGDGQDVLFPALHAAEPQIVVHNDPALPPYVREAIGAAFPIVALVVFQKLVALYLAYRARKDPKGARAIAEKLGKSKARFVADANTGVRFDDVAGIDTVKSELREVVRTLKHDQAYESLGVTTPKGILLYGPPGTGKTYLAKAVAAESGLPFFSANGAEFVEIFVGVAAARVRDLFARARAAEPCIIFIDEIDSIGRARGNSDPGTSEREQGLMQLLVEMDGFATDDTKILVMAATNRPQVLDDALLRKGRFDRKIEVGLPNRKGRLEVLKVHARNKLFPDEETKESLLQHGAQHTNGFTAAELANLLNEAAILAVRREKDFISIAEIDSAIEKVTEGLEMARYDEDVELRRRLATVEAGRAVVATMIEGHDRVRRVSIVPRGTTRSTTDFEDADKPQPVTTKRMVEDELCSMLAARATEEVVFGPMSVTLATANYVELAALVAHEMVASYGWTEMGLYTYDDSRFITESAREQMDSIREKLLAKAYSRARLLVAENRPAIEALATELLEVETVWGDRVREIVESSPKAVVDAAEAAAEAVEMAVEEAVRALALDGSMPVEASRIGVLGFGSSGVGSIAFGGPVLVSGAGSDGGAPHEGDVGALAEKTAAGVGTVGFGGAGVGIVRFTRPSPGGDSASDDAGASAGEAETGEEEAEDAQPPAAEGSNGVGSKAAEPTEGSDEPGGGIPTGREGSATTPATAAAGSVSSPSAPALPG